MRESILKLYETEKKNIDIWFLKMLIDKTLEAKQTSAAECIFHIGEAYMLAQIIETEFAESTGEERIHMDKIKEYLEEIISSCFTVNRAYE